MCAALYRCARGLHTPEAQVSATSNWACVGFRTLESIIRVSPFRNVPTVQPSTLKAIETHPVPMPTFMAMAGVIRSVSSLSATGVSRKNMSVKAQKSGAGDGGRSCGIIFRIPNMRHTVTVVPFSSTRTSATLQPGKHDDEIENEKNTDELLHYIESLKARGASAANTAECNDVLSKLSEISSSSNAVTVSSRAAEEALAILDRMDMNEGNAVRPDAMSFLHAMKVCSYSSREDAGDCATKLLRRFEKLGEDEDIRGDVASSVRGESRLEKNTVKATTAHYNAVIKALSNSSRFGDRSAPYKARVIFDEMKHPTTESYNALIECWIRSGDSVTAAMRAQEVYEEMVEKKNTNMTEYDTSNLSDPDGETMSMMIKVWSDSKRKDAAFHATRHLQSMEHAFLQSSSLQSRVDEESPLDSLSPTSDLYASVLNAWSRGKDVQMSAHRASSIFRIWEHLRKEGPLADVKPNAACYKALLTCWAKVAINNAMGEEEEEEELSDVVHATEDDDDNVRAEAAKKADEILSLMLTLSDAGDKTMEPDQESFSLVIAAWGRCAMKNDDLAPTKAQVLLRRMEEMAESDSKNQTFSVPVRPTSDNYADVIRSWSNVGNGDAASNAEKVLLRMEHLYDEYELQVDDNDESKNTRAQEDDYGGKKSVSIRPTWQSYVAVIEAWGKAGSGGNVDGASRAAFILRHMWERFRVWSQKQQEQGQNRSEIHETVDTREVLSKCGDAIYTKKDLNLSRNLISSRPRPPAPGVDCHNAVLAACARSSGNERRKKNSFRIALKTLKSLRGSRSCHRPNEQTYALLVKCCGSLIPAGKEREEAVKAVFRQAASDGKVGKDLLEQLRYAATFEMYEQLVRGNGSVEDIPLNWRRNVGEHLPETGARMMIVSQRPIPSEETLRTKKNQKLRQGGRLTMSEIRELQQQEARR